MRHWDIASGELVRELAGHTGFVVLALGSHGRKLASADTNESIFLWDTESGARVAEWTAANPVSALACSQTEALLVSGEWDGVVELWKI